MKWRAGKCTCNNCVGDYEDAVDRTEWAFQYGHWKIKKQPKKGQKAPEKKTDEEILRDDNDDVEGGETAPA